VVMRRGARYAMRTTSWLLVVLCVLVRPPAVTADEWAPPTIRTYYSPDHRVRFTVTPRGIESPLAYFQDKVNDAKPAGQRPGGEAAAHGLLEREGPRGQWARVWEK